MWMVPLLALLACYDGNETASGETGESESGCRSWFIDADGDGAGDPETSKVTCDPDEGLIEDGGDCDDRRASVYPGAAELCGDGLVNDCDSDALTAAGVCPMGDGSTLDKATAWTGQLPADLAGRALASAGDFNGDGLTDLVVGAYAEFAEPDDAGAGQGGAAYLILGSAQGFIGGSLDNAAARWTGSLSHNAGRAVSPLGDLNGDGFDDLLVGAFGVTEKGDYSGAAYVLPGSADPKGHPLSDGIAFLGENPQSEAGYALSGVGDANGDGHPDFVVGAPHEDTTGTDAGTIYLVLGDGGIPTGGDLEDMDGLLRGEARDDHLGEWVAPAGDVDGDGIADVAIGAYKESTWGQWAGAVYVFQGGDGLMQGQASDAWKWTGESVNGRAGVCVDGAGDMDGDGYGDVVVGANLSGEGGMAYVLRGGSEGLGSGSLANASMRIVGSPDAGLGLAVSGGGDLDGDGHDDVLLGAPTADNHVGVSLVVLGAEQLPGTTLMNEGWLVDAGALGGHQGEAVYFGDVTNDGLADVFVGAPTAQDQAGQAYLLVGGGY